MHNALVCVPSRTRDLTLGTKGELVVVRHYNTLSAPVVVITYARHEELRGGIPRVSCGPGGNTRPSKRSGSLAPAHTRADRPSPHEPSAQDVCILADVLGERGGLPGTGRKSAGEPRS